MGYENIRLRKQNFTIVNGYFWTIDEDTDSVIVKTDDGTLAYSYPLDTTIPGSEPVISLEFDGYNLWSLRDTGTNEVTIQRWHISNYICTLRDTFQFVATGSDKYDASTFTVEHYHTTFSADEGIGQSTLSVTDGSKMESNYTIVLGPNGTGQLEEKTVVSAGAGSVQIDGTTTYEYLDGDPISFYKRIWLFNNYYGTETGEDKPGGLYEIDAYTGSYTAKYPLGAYKDITACSFFNVPKYVFDGGEVTEPKYDCLCYIKGTNILFLNPDDLDTSYASMTMDNVQDDQATTIPIYDLAFEGTNVYRLQLKATYYGTTVTFTEGPYNYQLSSLNSFIASISLSAEPAILPANGVNTSTITAIVKDQFNLPVAQRIVNFTDDDPVGGITTAQKNTNEYGVAVTGYLAGTSAREVRITATSQQS